uniref:Glutathione synthetase n=1 Tax=Globodera pallida TaxID=36090 RepID=A0A183C1Q4_GLOPA
MSNLTIFVVLFTFSASFFTCSTTNPSHHNSDEGENSSKKDEIKNIQNYASDVVKDEKHLGELALYAIEWAHNNGLVLLSRETDIVEFAPISLFPSPFPRRSFEKALSVQKDMNLLYFRVASDYEFMAEAFKDLIPVDAHIAKLWQIVKEVHEEGIRQPFTLLIQRADYMLNVVENPSAGEEQYQIKQVEVNGGSICGLGLKRRNSELHRQMLRKVGMDVSASPVNQPDVALVEALHMAWKQFGDPNALLILHLDPEDFSLRRNSDGRRVAVVYSNMSALGYAPKLHYDVQMEARKMIERSTAIKAPSLAIGISCTKKIQQDAMETPANYVLKPNRECGGNNYFDEQIPEAFQKFTPEERKAHILMQKLRPMAVPNYMLRPLQEPIEASVVPELGVYGFLLGNMVDGSVQHNVQQGYHFRSKFAHLNEGGITAGFGFYDTAYLF